jgi:hypothetical protein
MDLNPVALAVEATAVTAAYHLPQAQSIPEEEVALVWARTKFLQAVLLVVVVL